MGPRVDNAVSTFTLRPFRTAQTYLNLKRHGEGVLHVTDDVELFAHAAVGHFPTPPCTPARAIQGYILNDCCRWFAFRVVACDETNERAEFHCETVDRGTQRDFFGFNRAKHAVLEAAILATRLHILPLAEIEAEFAKLAVIVRKTAGPTEHRAFAFLENYIRQPSS